MDVGERASLIGSCPLFASMHGAAIRALAHRASVMDYAEGAVVIWRGAHAEWLPLVAEGAVRLCVNTPNGRQLTLCLRGRGEPACLASMADGEAECLDVVAHGSVRILRLPWQAVARELQGKAAPEILHRLAAGLHDLVDAADSICPDPLEARLARLLLRLQREGRLRPVMRPHRLTQSILASMIGASRPKVNAGLCRLQQVGAIEIVQGATFVRDPALLRRLARADPPPKQISPGAAVTPGTAAAGRVRDRRVVVANAPAQPRTRTST